MWDGRPKQGSAAIDQRQIRTFLMRVFERALIPASDREKFPTCPGTCLETAHATAPMLGEVVAVPRRRSKEES